MHVQSDCVHHTCHMPCCSHTCLKNMSNMWFVGRSTFSIRRRNCFIFTAVGLIYLILLLNVGFRDADSAFEIQKKHLRYEVLGLDRRTAEPGQTRTSTVMYQDTVSVEISTLTTASTRQSGVSSRPKLYDPYDKSIPKDVLDQRVLYQNSKSRHQITEKSSDSEDEKPVAQLRTVENERLSEDTHRQDKNKHSETDYHNTEKPSRYEKVGPANSRKSEKLTDFGSYKHSETRQIRTEKPIVSKDKRVSRLHTTDTRKISEKASSLENKATRHEEVIKEHSTSRYVGDGFEKENGIKSKDLENALRLDNIQRMCANPSLRNLPRKLRHPHVYEAKPFNLAYCFFKTSGSKPMKNAIRMMALQNVSSFQTYYNEAVRINEFSWWPNVSISELDTLIISRNPYERLYSGYRDRLFLFIEMTGRKKCLNHVGFENFLRHVLARAETTPETVDGHFAPLSWRCRPCEQNLKYIVKFENFAKELDYVWNKIGAKGPLLKVLGEITDGTLFKNEEVNGRAEVKMKLFYTAERKCITELEMAKRLWSELQREGFLDSSVGFPEEFFNKTVPLSAENLGLIAKKAILAHPISAEQAKRQRTEAFTKAYSNIPTDVIKKIQQLYYADFLLFGYDLEPKF